MKSFATNYNPLDDGGVIFQWSFAPVFATLEVKHDDYVIMHQFDTNTDASQFAEFDALPDDLEDFLTGVHHNVNMVKHIHLKRFKRSIARTGNRG